MHNLYQDMRAGSSIRTRDADAAAADDDKAQPPQDNRSLDVPGQHVDMDLLERKLGIGWQQDPDAHADISACANITPTATSTAPSHRRRFGIRRPTRRMLLSLIHI